MRYRRMPIEIESPEELGYDTIDANLAESSFRDRLGFGWPTTDELHRGLAALSEAATRAVR